jgi:DNA-directed RNA polymerase subunit RPC12/RpoP
MASFERVPIGSQKKESKVKFQEAMPITLVSLKTLVGLIAIGILFFFGIIFALASVYASSRLIVALMFFVVGFGIAYYISRKPKTVVQRLELSGQMSAAALKCPNCGASVDANQIKIISGVPYATCRYCGHTFEVAEEPKW